MNIFKTRISETEQSLTKLQEEHDSLNALFDESRTSLISMTEANATLKSELARVTEDNKGLLERIETLEAEVAEVSRDSVTFEASVAEKAIDLVASIGVPPVDAAPDDQDALDVVATFKTLKGKELQEYYNLHKQEIFKSLNH